MPRLFVCLFIVECGYAVSVGIVLQKNRTEPSTKIWGQKPIETDRKRKIPHRNNTKNDLCIFYCCISCIYHYTISVNCISLHHVFLESVLVTTKGDGHPFITLCSHHHQDCMSGYNRA